MIGTMRQAQTDPSTETRVAFLSTGGTVACTADAAGDLRPTLTARDLLRAAGADTDGAVTGRDVMTLDSSSLTLADIDALLAAVVAAHRDGAEAVVVTHGTDSLEETAMAVDRMVGVPVVLTAAQRPADDPDPDGPANIRAALAEARRLPAAPRIVVGGSCPAYGATKRHTTDLDAFRVDPATRRPAPLTADPAPLDGLRVDIVTAYAGAPRDTVDAALDAGADGLVVAAMGSGNIGDDLDAGVRRALDAGVPVLVASRVAAGGVHLVYGGAGGGSSLARHGARSAGALSPAQARMSLLCELAVARRDGDGS
ncbi:L-asparaginase [Corynebacterium bovis DSM 20582 = CIP 54.80]|nr:L-asparaginase [Corynebacterium bovis DSM 20582 = CIP 54.80]